MKSTRRKHPRNKQGAIAVRKTVPRSGTLIVEGVSLEKSVLAILLAVLATVGLVALIARLLPIHGALLGAVLVVIGYFLFRLLLIITVGSLASGGSYYIPWEITDELLILHGYADSKESEYIPLESIKEVLVSENEYSFIQHYPEKAVRIKTDVKNYMFNSTKKGEEGGPQISMESIDVFMASLQKYTHLVEKTD